jgi:hypothetical protein
MEKKLYIEVKQNTRTKELIELQDSLGVARKLFDQIRRKYCF